MKFIKKLIIRTLLISTILFIISSAGALLIYTRYPLDYKEYIGKYSNEYEIDPYLVASVINVESRFDKNAVSSKDARGLMQIAEQTGQWGARELKIENYTGASLFEPETNIRIGSWYIKKLEREFDDRLDLVLAAYNGGSGNVSKWLKNEEYSSDGIVLDKIPFKETENYLERVKKTYKIYKRVYKDVSFQDDSFNSRYVSFLYKIKNSLIDR